MVFGAVRDRYLTVVPSGRDEAPVPEGTGARAGYGGPR